ncbi:MAG: biopolymer transport protein ExbB [Cryomorphaceae bacterium]|jgi:biopolymer transport protein ExbB
MIRLITSVALAAAISMSIAPAQAQTVDQLLAQVKSGALQKTKAATDLEARFRSAGNGKATIVNDLRTQRATLEARSDTLENQYAVNDEALNQVRNARQRSLGDLKELFGAIQQVVGEAQAGFDTSIISAQFPGRSEQLNKLARKVSNQDNEMVTAAEIEGLWASIFNEMAQQGKVVSFEASVATASGSKETRSVVRVGTFNLLSGDKFLTYGTGGVTEYPRQPAGQYTSQAGDLASAAAGSAVNFALDPTQGTLLGAAVENPSLGERIDQGGLVGYIILSVGALAAVIAIWKIITLFGVSSAVAKQAANPDSPSDKNPLGRVLKAVTDNPSNDTEAMELRLSEAIMKETPKLTSWLMFLKIVSVVAPLAGLLGTVLGMITTFQSITLFGAGDPKLMAGGISQALVTTVCGLVVAIPIVLLHTAAASKAKRVEEVLEEQSAGMVARQIEG